MGGTAAGDRVEPVALVGMHAISALPSRMPVSGSEDQVGRTGRGC
jgi:hypothetical protein